MSAIVVADLQPFEDGPRVRDIRLGERLGYAMPHRIRDLIERNAEELLRYGGLSRRRTNPGAAGGRPGEEYWLNEGQALVVVMKADTRFAVEAREDIIAVFMAWRYGKLAPVEHKSEMMQIAEMFDARLDRCLEKLGDKLQASVAVPIARLENKVDKIDNRVIFLEERLQPKKPKFSPESKEQIRRTCHERFGGKCACGCGIQILDQAGKPLSNYNVDHFNRELNSAEDGWPTNRECNLKLRNYEFRKSKEPRFRVFQEERRALFPDKKSPRIMDIRKIDWDTQARLDLFDRS